MDAARSPCLLLLLLAAVTRAEEVRLRPATQTLTNITAPPRPGHAAALRVVTAPQLHVSSVTELGHVFFFTAYSDHVNTWSLDITGGADFGQVIAMGDAAEAQYEADLARAMELSLRTHAAEAAWRRDSGQVQLPAPAPGGCLHVYCPRVGAYLAVRCQT